MKKRIHVFIAALLAVNALLSAQTDTTRITDVDYNRRPTREDSIRFRQWEIDSKNPTRTYVQGNTMQDPIPAGTYSTDFYYTITAEIKNAGNSILLYQHPTLRPLW